MNNGELNLTAIIEAAIFAAGEPLSIERLLQIFVEDERPAREQIQQSIAKLQEKCGSEGVVLQEVASGYCFQVKDEFVPWIARLWPEKQPRYSRTLLETLAIIAYRQPMTRAEIEDIRGVAVSSQVIHTLLERGWVRLLGHRDLPGKPGIYGTTKEFLDYFNLQGLSGLPTLPELSDMDEVLAKRLLEAKAEAAGDEITGVEVAEVELTEVETAGDEVAEVEVAEVAEVETVGDEVAEVEVAEVVTDVDAIEV